MSDQAAIVALATLREQVAEIRRAVVNKQPHWRLEAMCDVALALHPTAPSGQTPT